jgi:hypothetical protein
LLISQYAQSGECPPARRLGTPTPAFRTTPHYHPRSLLRHMALRRRMP